MFDSALHKTSNLISTYLLQSPTREQPATITQRIEKILANFDRLNELQIGGNGDKRESNLEALRRMLQREAYFLDEEKKWLALKQQPSPNKSTVLLEVDGESRELQLLQQNLKMERDLQCSLNQQLEEDISFAQVEHSRLAEMERHMNEQKLRLLLKFEKIKMLEEYYNQNNSP